MTLSALQGSDRLRLAAGREAQDGRGDGELGMEVSGRRGCRARSRVGRGAGASGSRGIEKRRRSRGRESLQKSRGHKILE